MSHTWRWSVPILTLLLLMVVPATATPSPWVHVDGTTHYYDEFTFEGGLTWDQAKADAESRTYLGLQGHLVTVTSQAEQDFLTASFDDVARVDQTVAPWMGAFQPSGSPEPDGGWQWVTGEPWGYTNWAPAQPDNNGIENAGHFAYGYGRWNDLRHDDSAPAAYILEYDGLPEPATLSLLALGGLAVLRRKR